MKIERKDSLYILAIIFSIVFFYSRILFSKENLIIASPLCDLPCYFYPFRAFFSQIIKDLSLPLWCPNLKCGISFIGTMQSAMFYPLNALFILLPISSAFNISVIMHLCLSGIFTYLLVKRISKNNFAGFISGIIYVFCAQQILRIYAGHAGITCAMAWTPLLFFLIDKAIDEKNIQYIIYSSIVLAIQIFSGYIQYVFYLGIFILIYYLSKTIYLSYKNKKYGNNILYFCSSLSIFFIIAFGITAIQIFPALELSLNSARQKMNYEFCSSFSFPPENLISFLFPDFFGDDINVSYFGRINIWEACTYAGIAGIVLPIIGIVFKRGFYKNIFFLLILLSVILGLGKFTPLFKFLYYYMPGFNLFRGTAKFFLFTSFFLSVLSGLGISVIFDEYKKLKENKILVKFSLFCLILSSVLIIFVTISAGSKHLLIIWLKVLQGFKYLNGILPFDYKDPVLFVKSFDLACQSILRTLYLLFLFAGIFLLRLKTKISSTTFKLSLILLVIGDLFLFSLKYAVGFDSKICYLDNKTTLFFKQRPDQYFRINSTYFDIWNRGMSDNLCLIGGLEHATTERFEQLLPLITTMPNPIYTFIDKINPITQMLNTKYYIFPKGTAVNHPCLVPVFNGEETDIYEDKNALPRTFIVHKAVVLDNSQSILNKMASPEFNPKEEAILETYPDIPLSIPNKPESVDIIKYSPNSVSINALLKSNGILILSDNYFPGWEVYVDGKKEKILIANYTLRAVELQEGMHNVIFIYRPKSFRYGLIISCVSIFVTILLLFVLKNPSHPSPN